MLYSNKKILLTFFFAIFIYSVAFSKEIRKASVVFRKWLDTQEVYKDVDITAMAGNLNNSFIRTFKERYENYLPFLRERVQFLKKLTNGQIEVDAYQIKDQIDWKMKANLIDIYDSIARDMPSFINYLKNNDFISQINSNEIDTPEKNLMLLHLLLACSDSYHEQETLFAIANKFFEYCFGSSTVNEYKKLSNDSKLRQLSTFLKICSSQILGQQGWKDWHQNSLDLLKARSINKREVIYLGGGTDIYQLIISGIYNIRVIDPFLPSQIQYYGQDWEFLLHSNFFNGGIGDEIWFGPAFKNIKMKREKYAQGEEFATTLSNEQSVQIKKSETSWQVLDNDNKIMGTVTFERRKINQNDLIPENNKLFLISYNELPYFVAPKDLMGWDINIAQLSQELEIIVKQLSKPISKKTLATMRAAMFQK